jgi:hypothetical protein
MSRARDRDLKQLRAADKALCLTSPRMRLATLEYLRDKYLFHKPQWLKDQDMKPVPSEEKP